MSEPEVSVGIVSANEMKFTLNAKYLAKGRIVEGEQVVEYVDGGIRWDGSIYQELNFVPQEENASFSLYEVTIGIHFHWERKETQIFSGSLRFIVEEGKLCAINVLPVEDYLISVISSEMSASASLEFLKAHAVISRSWLLAQMEKRKRMEEEKSGVGFFSFKKTDSMLVRWYDREDHTIFDVCADDHCQRYQGITKAWNENVVVAVKATRGRVLTSEGKICDARFSKCCGGMTEEFENCWEDVHKPYLVAKRDYLETSDGEVGERFDYDLTMEEDAEKWILNPGKSFCDTTSKGVLSQILNNYDQETTNFYRWRVEYTQKELSGLISANMKMEFGKIVDLVPVKRGKSGRISLLKIIGTEKTFTIGKELEIRRVLSDSHLFSSAFIVKKIYGEAPAPSFSPLLGKEEESELCRIPEKFVICGAGWGHGVGLCQIGAAVMGEKGYTYDAILAHYYPDAELVRKY